jgi:hypothetical protein|tara:strand:+ start:676 stop:981 length:306 start_codon:yes stop_codon:yes gene_type:complete
MSYKPKEVIIAGHKFTIVYKTMKDYGELDSDDKKIYISNKIKGEMLLDTIIHEGFHAMLAVSGLGYILEDVQGELEEALVRAYENILTPFIKQQYREFYKK